MFSKKLFGAMLFVVISLVMVGSSYVMAANKGPVVVIVNGKSIYRQDVMNLIEKLPMQPNTPIEQVYPMVIDQIINEELVAGEASTKVKMDDPEVQRRMAIAKEQIVRGLYMERQMQNIVTDKAVKAEYKKFMKENKGKQETRARHILVKSEDEAKAIIKQLDGGAKFVDLAKEKSIGPSAPRGGDLGYFTEGDMVPEFSKVAFKTKKGKYAKAPVQTQFGWHVIYVEDRRKLELPKLEEIEGAIRNKLSQDAMGKLVKDLRKNAEIKRFSLDGQPLN